MCMWSQPDSWTSDLYRLPHVHSFSKVAHRRNRESMSQISWPEGRPRGFQDKEASIEPYSREREKSFTGTSITEDPLPPPDALAVDFKHDLHRGLKSRQIAMVGRRIKHSAHMFQIAIGGAIGTGLIIGTGGSHSCQLKFNLLFQLPWSELGQRGC